MVAMYGLVSELARTGGAADSRAAVRKVRLCAMESQKPGMEFNEMHVWHVRWHVHDVDACSRPNHAPSLSRLEECSHDTTFTYML